LVKICSFVREQNTIKMRNKIAIISIIILTFFNLGLKAQTSVTASGISIQGIARDLDDRALANFDQLNLVFSLYYLNSSNSEQIILNKTANVTTDNFGVFSYVLVIDQQQYNLISTKEAYLKVVQGSVVFSNEKLQSVPYAIHAQNGVPTGSVMPFIGTVAPNGWLLCDGSSFTDNDYTANLKALLGSNTTPNLKGLFLRGTGAAATGETGPALKAIQQDDVIAHAHSVNINTSDNGTHNHGIDRKNEGLNGGNKNDMWGTGGGSVTTTRNAGNHTHNVSGNTANNGSAIETRPINYGINYIIKI
jgi:microcystin-dependent protein